MSRARPTALVVALVLAAVTALGAAGAAAAAPEPYVKYYVVQDSYQGRPETLPAIAQRLLGAAGRAGEIQNLNAGRVQPDGQALGADRALRAGWALVLPWDAAGDGVQYGALPAAKGGTPAAPPTVAVARPGNPTPPPTTKAAPHGSPSVAAPAATPAKTQSAAPPPPAAGTGATCAAAGSAHPSSAWAYERIAADAAWERTRGDGVLVAVVDSGVDAAAPALAGRVTLGADIVAGTGRGDADCLGSGTAMAGIIAADADGFTGVAPAATVMPVRIVTDSPRPRPKDTATAIGVAVSAGAKVVALGSYVDLTDPGVIAAIEATAGHDVVFVAAAPTASGDAPHIDADLLRVAGVGPDGQLAADYRPGSVDVLAPGIDIATLAPGAAGGRASSGSQYAVAFAAGVAALVRSAMPALGADRVIQRLRSTADRTTAQVPDPATGYGMVNPRAAVSMVLEGEQPAAAKAGGSGGGTGVLVTLLIVTAAALLAIGLWRTLPRRGDRLAPEGSHDDVPGRGDRLVPGDSHDGAPGRGERLVPEGSHDDAPGRGDRLVPGGSHDGAPGRGDRLVPGGPHDGAPGRGERFGTGGFPDSLAGRGERPVPDGPHNGPHDGLHDVPHDGLHDVPPRDSA